MKRSRNPQRIKQQIACFSLMMGTSLAVAAPTDSGLATLPDERPSTYPVDSIGPGVSPKSNPAGRSSYLKLVAASALIGAVGNSQRSDRPWRSLPLITDGKVDKAWSQIGYGTFAVDNGALRTDCEDKGMGLLLYTKEQFGNCQIRVVYKSEKPKSNSGVFVRIDRGIVGEIRKKTLAVQRDKDGELLPGELQKMKDASAADNGPWYAVHHGYEVQICDDADDYHHTGSIYSLSKAAPVPAHEPETWRTMVITLKGNLVLVSIDGKDITKLDPESKDVPSERIWFEPKREPKRPEVGYIGLQTHDPGDVVYFKEVSVRPLE